MLKLIFNNLNRNNKNLFNIINNKYFLQKNNVYSTSITNALPTINVIKNPDNERTLKILQLELDVLYQEGHKVPNPENLKTDDWDNLLNLKSRSARRKFYTFLFHKEKKKENFQIKKDIKKQENVDRNFQLRESNKTNDHIIYSLMHTSFLLRIYDATINLWHNNRLIQAMQFGQKIVLDCSYDKYMTKREAINAAKQIMILFSDNRNHINPFDIHLCNLAPNSTTMIYLLKHIPTLLDKEFPLNVHENSFMDLFPKEQLVYLTPHCKTDMNSYSHDSIYIIGAMVDKVNNEPLSLGKAKSLGLKMARLPLDQYLQWGCGSGKSLTLNQMTNIMLDMKTYNNWNRALKHIPKRKLFNDRENNYNDNEKKYDDDDIPETEIMPKNNYKRVGFDKSGTSTGTNRIYNNTNLSGQTAYRDKSKKFIKKIIIPDLFDK